MDHVKVTGITLGEITVLGGSMLATKKFLDFNTLFKKNIEKDPAFAERWFIQHQGAIKFVGFALAASFVKNPWIKIALLGASAVGFIEEVRVLTKDSKGVSFFDAIGQQSAISNMSDLDQRMKEAAQKAEREAVNGTGLAISQQYPTAVSDRPVVTQDNRSAVGAVIMLPGIDSDNYQNSSAVGIAV